MGVSVENLLTRYFSGRDDSAAQRPTRPGEPASTGLLPFLLDAHFHLGFTADPAGVAAEADRLGIGAFSCTVTPREYLALGGQLAHARNVVVGVGLHPWWIGVPMQKGEVAQPALLQPGDVDSDLECLLDEIPGTELVGEVGLDFSKRHVDTASAQVRVLEAVLAECSRLGGCTLSLHCVHAHDQMFDLLERFNVTDSCRVVFHWFSGSGDDLARARRKGCWFSVGPRMLASKRGRSYASQMPRERLLLETDGPCVDALAGDFEPAEIDVDAWRHELESVFHFRR